LGCQWSDPKASGVQSIVWRSRWEAGGGQSFKERLVQYNAEDCQALRKVVEFLIAVTPPSSAEGQEGTPRPKTVNTAELQAETRRGPVFRKAQFALPEFDYANKCAYFDYQRVKVFVRTNKNLKKSQKAQQKRSRGRSRRVTRSIEVKCARCLLCGSKMITALTAMSKQVVDLQFFTSGARRRVTEYSSWRYRCDKCGRYFNPPEVFPNAPKYGYSLACWCVYQNVAGGQNLLKVGKVLSEVFHIALPQQQLYRFKSSVTESHQETYQSILEEILRGPIIHVDETEVMLRKQKGYVWVFTNMERVYYCFKSTREGSFLKEMLKPFSGVLISDFYTAYDSLNCPQQKCLLHLMRDFNDDLLKSPFNEELRAIATQFASLLKKIVESIDKYGLRRRHLQKHWTDVDRFMRLVKSTHYVSDTAQGYQARLEKCEGKLFTFLNYDGVPWNNNNAEHAIKVFARHRTFADGRFTEQSINEYLVLLSLYQSCEYQEINFLEYLLSTERAAKTGFGPGKQKRTE
jgi:hypothetical protein